MTEIITKRALIVINKWWECNPIMNVLLNDYAHLNLSFLNPKIISYNGQFKKTGKFPRVIFSLPNIKVELWCISDLLTQYPNEPKHQSSSQRKMEEMSSIFEYSNQSPDLVLAMGTAASYPQSISLNGSVIVGTKVFMHNCHPNGSNQHSDWVSSDFDKVISSPIKKSDFLEIIDIETDPPSVMNRFFMPPLNPDPFGGRLIADYDFIALNTINVTDYSEYSIMDTKTIESYQKRYNLEYCKSIETTHGLIRVAAGLNTKFLFISGIANRWGNFNVDVEPRRYAQNTSCAHNAGIVVASMLPKINNIV